MEPRRTSPLKGLLDRVLAVVQGRTPLRAVLLTGGIAAGKTSTGLRLLSLLRQSSVRVGGFLAPRVLDGDATVGYSLIDLATNTTHPFASLDPGIGSVAVGRFFVSERGLAVAKRAVTSALDSADVVFVDEVGRLELDGEGHAAAVRRLLAADVVPILLVRDTLVEDVVRTFALDDPIVFPTQDALDATVTGAAGAQTFWRIVDALPYPLLITLGDDGFPWSRPMLLAAREGNSLWFATSRASQKVTQIEANPYVTVVFVDSTRFNYASIHGEAHVVVDADRERKLWQDDWKDDWPDGPSDPDYVLLRIDGIRGYYLRGTTGETGTLDLRSTSA